MLKLIDVSEHQGKINWEKVKPQIDGAILRCGYGMDIEKQDDTCFKRNADECTRLGIPFGVYLYSYADSVEKAKSEAAHVLRVIKGYKLSYPVYYDLEENGTQKGAVERANIFGDIIEKAGYWCGVYANLNWWNNYLPGLDRFTKWVAQYNKTCDYKGVNLDIWQYSSKGKVDGIEGNVDMNECYRDFPKEIKDVVSKEDTYTLEQFIRDIQSVTGSEVDGIAGKETIGNTVTVSASVNRKNPVVEFVQKRLATLGYTEVGEIDGIAGSLFDSAVKRFQEENGCVKDGEITAENKTWRKLLGME
jgi:GH25 family lysozyme M1 (1,4-beta-N-acetylmuramidase)